MGPPCRPGVLYPLALLLILLITDVVSQGIPKFAALRGVLQARSVDVNALGSGATREILQRLRAVHLIPAESAIVRSTSPDSGESQILSLDPIPPEPLAEILRIDPLWLGRRVPIVAILMEGSDLDGIHANSFARGREWERPAFFAFLENGGLRLTTRVGVRIHGGWSRAVTSRRSYRIYFRRRYGIDHFPVAFFPTGANRSPRVLILRNNQLGDSVGSTSPFLNPLAFDIGRRLGAVAPHTKTVVFYLNGEFLGMYQMAERADRDYLLAHFGHDDFMLIRTEPLVLLGEKPGEWQWQEVAAVDKVKIGSPAVYQEFTDWVRELSDLDLETIAARVDLDSLSRWLLTNLYCGNHDPFQGSLLLDLRQPDGRWFWLLWDFDTSFDDSRPPRAVLQNILEPRRRDVPPDERSLLLNHLIQNSPEYRNHLARLFDESMNHRLTDEFVVNMLRHYRHLAATFEVPSDELDHLQSFLRAQPRKLRRLLRGTLHQGPTYKVTAKVPPGRQLVIAGYPSGSGFEGSYFSGMFVDLAIAEPDRKAFSHWSIRDETVDEPTIRLKIDSDLRIQAVFKSSEKSDSV